MIPPIFALATWPVVAFVLFRRLPIQYAICWTMVAGYLLIPFGIKYNLPMLPSLDKQSLPALSALALCLWILSDKSARGKAAELLQSGEVLPGWIPKSRIVLGLMVAMVGGAFMTVITNGDRLVYGATTLPGLRTYDAFSALMTAGTTLVPLLVARKFLATESGHRTLLTVLAIAGFAYSFLALYEIRMSPQLNVHLYGYFPSQWGMHLRGGGFRPVVFLRHGLWLGIFFACACLAALALFRYHTDKGLKFKFLFAGLWILGTVMLSKTITSAVILLAFVPVILFLNARLQLLAAAIVAGLVLLYPMVRFSQILPIEGIVSLARDFDPSRGASLQYRINNEEILLTKANERPLFGWGGWGRSRVYSEEGYDISTTDGRWIITMGQSGWVGYIGRFGLLTLPIILFAVFRRRYNAGYATSGLSVVLAGNLVDLIPNAGLTVITWTVAGALAGRLELSFERSEEDQSANAATKDASAPRPGTARQPGAATELPSTRGQPVYTRFANARSGRDTSHS